MRAATRESGHAALPGKPIGKALGRVWLAGPRRQINQMSDRRRVDAASQRRQDRKFVPLDDAFAALRLGENKLLNLRHTAVGQGLAKPALHLRTEPDDVAAAYPGIEQQIEGQPCLCADRMAGLVTRPILLAPGRE